MIMTIVPENSVENTEKLSLIIYSNHDEESSIKMRHEKMLQ